MNKKKRLFGRLVRKWVGLTYLGWWKIDVFYLGNKAYAKQGNYTKKHARRSAATCYSDWRYLEACIHVNLSVLKFMNKKQIEALVVHEMMHIFLDEMHEKGVEHEERTATLLARSFILCNGGRE